MSGFVERVIEDWLTNCDERSYQASLVSVLLRQGHKIRYVSKHSTLEFGKDIVSVSAEGQLSAYQLKAGNINLGIWRDIRGEVFELVEVRARSSSGRNERAQRCYLVTTGTIDDTVHEQLRDYNEQNRERDLPEIETVERHELVRIFTEVFAEFFPVGIGAFNDLVRLYMLDGAGPLDKPRMQSILRALVPVPASKAKVARTLSNVVVAAEFVSTPFRSTENHISAMDVWILAACHIVWLTRKFNLKESQARHWLDWCRDVIETYGRALLDEIANRENFVEGEPLVDLMVVQYRKTVVFGYAAAVVNAQRIRCVDALADARKLHALLSSHAPLGIWGEASWNYYLNLVIAIAASPEGDLEAARLVANWLVVLCSNERLESPYWTLESALSIVGIPESRAKDRIPAFYSLGGAIDLICRKMWRRPLAVIWPRLSKLESAELILDHREDYFGWEIDEGTVEIERLPIRGSWLTLRKNSFKQRVTLFWDDAAWLLPYMLCCYPHRVSRKLSGELDYMVASQTAKREWQADASESVES